MINHSARLSRHLVSTVSLIVVIGVLAISGTAALIVSQRSAAPEKTKQVNPLALAIVGTEDPLVSEPSPAGTAPAPQASPVPAPTTKSEAGPEPAANGQPKRPAPASVSPAKAAPASAPARNLEPYRGMGTWVDVYDYAIRDSMNIPAAVQTMADRGVKTLYLQTGRWKDPNDIVNVGAVNSFLDEAARRDIKVVGWYVPGFGDIDRDVRRSVAVFQQVSPAGNRFSGFAPDIETREEVGGDAGRYNAGVAEYSERLRAALPNVALGAIVDDAKNNLRAPERYAGFPWAQIGAKYDVILPMAYWSVTKAKNGGCGTEYDSEAYIREVVALTRSYMGVDKPVHPVGGIADCVTEAEVAGYVRAVKDLGIGGSLYDFATIQASSVPIWNLLRNVN